MRCQDDCDPVILQFADDVPHLFAQFDINPGCRLVKKQDAWFMAQRLSDHDAPPHSAGQGHILRITLVPEGQFFQQAVDTGLITRFVEQATRVMERILNLLKALQHNFLRHQADQGARLTVVIDDIEPLDRHAASCRSHQPANCGNQRRLAGTVRAKQGDHLTLLNIQRNALQRLGTIIIGFAKIAYGQNGRHRSL